MMDDVFEWDAFFESSVFWNDLSNKLSVSFEISEDYL